MKFTAAVEGFIKFISDALDEDKKEVITTWIGNNLLNHQTPSPRITQNIKAAFFEAQKIVFTEYIVRNDIEKMKLLLDAVNSPANEKLRTFECKVLADAFIEKQEFLTTSTQHNQELIEILNNQYENIESDELKESISSKIREVQQIIDDSIGGIVGPSTQVRKPHKGYLYKFIDKLFKTDMSQNVLVDIVINDDPTNQYDNSITIVGRPKVLGSSTKQMRHVTPYSFMEAAIKEKIVTTIKESDYVKYINNIAEAIKPLLKNKKGICLTDDQYSKLSSNIALQDEESERFKLSTTSNEYHLIYNDALIEQFKNCNDFSPAEKDKAQEDFSTKFEKYVTYGIKYLTEEILDPKDVDTITIVCERIAKIILILFNQEKYAAFPEEGNSLKEEIRVYQSSNDAEKPQNKKYDVYSHSEITEKMNDVGWRLQHNACIRIVDNEGPMVQRVAKVLKMLSSLVYHKVLGVSHKTEKKDLEYQKEYNKKYNFKVNDQNLKCQDKYNEDINIDSNLMKVFQYHVAKHLYSIFDFKPLEQNVLVPTQQGDNETITVYPSATGKTTAKYSVHEGKQYRELQHNSRKGYNDDVIFRSEMRDEKTKEILKDKVVNHVIISLLPFKGLEVGCMFDDAQCERATILQAFCELVKVKYEAEGMKQLDDVWVNDVQTECSRYFEDVLGESRVIEDNYYVV
jgi:hypothetical protein